MLLILCLFPTIAVIIGTGIYICAPEYSDGTWVGWIARHRVALVVWPLLIAIAFASLLWLHRQYEVGQVNCAFSYFGCDIRPPTSN